MDFLPPQCGGASHRTVAPHRRTAPRTVAPPQWAHPDVRHSVVARHRHRAPSHRPVACFTKQQAVVGLALFAILLKVMARAAANLPPDSSVITGTARSPAPSLTSYSPVSKRVDRLRGRRRPD